jgi:hypothetical protein
MLFPSKNKEPASKMKSLLSICFIILLTLGYVLHNHPAQANEIQQITLTASASSQISGLGPSNAVDQDVNTFWSSNVHSSANFTEWLSITFGQLWTIVGAQLTPRFYLDSSLGYPIDYRIEYTLDGSTWNPISGANYSNQPIPSDVVTHYFSEEIQAQGIRVVATELGVDNYGDHYFQLAEFSPVLLSASKEVDLGQVAHLDGVQITPRFGMDEYCYPIDYYFEYSYDEDGTYWFPLSGAVFEDQPEPTGSITHNFDARVLARRIRLVATKYGPDGSTEEDFQLIEVQPVTGTAQFPFETSNDEYYDARLNMLWAVYGNFWDGSAATYTFGNEPAWYEWVSLKYGWSESTRSQLNYLRNNLLAPWPQSSDGYIWSWSTQEKWPTGEGSYHQENNSKYILGAWRIWCWTRDDEFFEQIDPSSTGDAPRPDVSAGKTVKEKLREAMRYLEESLQGQLGGIPIEDNGMGNTGRPDGEPTNYWDNWPFGYYNAYDSIYYYAALEAMAQMELYWGNPNRAAELRNLAEGCKEDYFNKFWNSTRGRFIACIDKDGSSWDFGGTFHNLEALAYGLGDQSKADSIFSWLDGTRIIPGDTSTGTDIYKWKFAPRSNTLKVESIGPPYWWFSINGAISVESNAQWDIHLENGGAIFYTSFYDLMARLQWLGPDSALERLNVILDEFKTDQLRRDPNVWQLGIIGEFPESGLVPCFLVYGFAGIEPDVHGLQIHPQLPSTWDHLTVQGVKWAGCDLTITVFHDQVEIVSSSTSSGVLYIGNESLSPGEQTTVNLEQNGVLLALEPYGPTALKGWELYE